MEKEKEPTEARNNDLEPPARTKKYITSIMDEGSSDNMDEAGIPMLVSRYIKITVYIMRVQRGHKSGTYC